MLYLIGKKYAARSSLELEDLVQEGALGLMRAARLFDPELGVKFSTYASIWIRSHMQKALDKAKPRSKNRAGKAPERAHLSLDKTVREGELETYHDIVPDPNAPNPEAIAAANQAKTRLRKAIAGLPKQQERRVMTRRMRGDTFEAIALDFGVTRQRIQQIEAKAIERLRKALA